MMVTPQLSQEIDKLLPKAQEELATLIESGKATAGYVPSQQELTEIMLTIGDIDLLVKKTTKYVR